MGAFTLGGPMEKSHGVMQTNVPLHRQAKAQSVLSFMRGEEATRY